jgi:hypothetical protein
VLVVDRVEVALGQEGQVLAVDREGRLGVGEPAVGDIGDLAVGDAGQPQAAERPGRGLGPGQPRRVGRPGQAGHLPVVGMGQLGDLARGDVDDVQAPVERRHRDLAPVRGRGQLAHPADQAARQAARRRRVAAGRGGADLQGIGPVGVGHPHDVPAGPEHRGQPGPAAGGDRQGQRRAVAVAQPVHRPAHVDRAGPAGRVARQRADVVVGGDEPGRAAGRDRAEGDLERPGRAGVQPVKQPDGARAGVNDPLAVAAGLSCVAAVVVGVPPQAGAVQRARVEVAGALVVGQEGQPAADQHGAGELAADPGQQPREGRGRARVAVVPGPKPQAPAGAAPVALPPGRVPPPAAGQQGHAVRRHVQVGDLAVGQCGVPHRLRARSQAEGVGPGEGAERLARVGDREDLAGRRPAAGPGGARGPVGQPAGGPAVGGGHVDLGRVVAAAGPGHLRAVGREAGPGGQGLIGRQPPAAPAGGRREPHVVFRHERDQIAMHMREPEVSGGSHRLILGRGPPPRQTPAATAVTIRSDPFCVTHVRDDAIGRRSAFLPPPEPFRAVPRSITIALSCAADRNSATLRTAHAGLARKGCMHYIRVRESLGGNSA